MDTLTSKDTNQGGMLEIPFFLTAGTRARA